MSYEPERSLEPPEPMVLLHCDNCGYDICDGDEYYKMPESELYDCLCPDCAQMWLDVRRMVAHKED